MNTFLIRNLCHVMMISAQKAEYRRMSKCNCGNFKPYGLTITGCVAAMMPFYMCVNCEK